MCQIWATAHGCWWAGRCCCPQPTCGTRARERTHTHLLVTCSHKSSLAFLLLLISSHLHSLPLSLRFPLLTHAAFCMFRTHGFLSVYGSLCPPPWAFPLLEQLCWWGGGEKASPSYLHTVVLLSPDLQGHADVSGKQEGLPTGTFQLGFFVPEKQRGASTLQVEAPVCYVPMCAACHLSLQAPSCPVIVLLAWLGFSCRWVHGVTGSSAPRGVGCHEQLASQKGPGSS